jgi:hypothetical protein
MSNRYNELATRIFELLKGYGYSLSIYDSKGTKILVPRDARAFFSKSADIAVFIFENGAASQIRVFLGGTADDPTTQHIKLLRLLRKTAVRYAVGYSVRKYGKTLQPKLFAFMLADQITESYKKPMVGTSRSSYQRIGESQLIIRHTDVVNTEVRGSRNRHIESIFLETPEGERLKLQYNYLPYARALAVHYNNNGTMMDKVGKNILTITENIKKLNSLSKHVWEQRSNLSEAALELRTCAKEHIEKYKELLANMTKPSQYSNTIMMVENIEVNIADNDSINKIKEILGLVENEEQHFGVVLLANLVTDIPSIEPVIVEQTVEGSATGIMDNFEDWFSGFDPNNFLKTRKAQFAATMKEKADKIKKNDAIIMNEMALIKYSNEIINTRNPQKIKVIYEFIGERNFNKLMTYIRETFKTEIVTRVVLEAKNVLGRNVKKIVEEEEDEFDLDKYDTGEDESVSDMVDAGMEAEVEEWKVDAENIFYDYYENSPMHEALTSAVSDIMQKYGKDEHEILDYLIPMVSYNDIEKNDIDIDDHEGEKIPMDDQKSFVNSVTLNSPTSKPPVDDLIDWVE